jgi:hypothetical protein
LKGKVAVIDEIPLLSMKKEGFSENFANTGREIFL